MTKGCYDLGPHSRRVSTSSAAAQQWFDQGLNWRYGFNWEAAIDCFVRSASEDPACAMAHWGVAYALGPYYSRRWEDFPPAGLEQAVARAHEALNAARADRAPADETERALIEALAERYPSPKPADFETMGHWNDAYADAMRRVHARYPDDLDVAALFAEAMMIRTPWQLWDSRTGEPTERADTFEIVDVLERGLARANAAGVKHPMLLHLYVHALEMSPHPERALAAADALRTLAPDAGHMLHMPSHIDVQIGHYAAAIEATDRAIAADRRYAANEGVFNFYTSSRCHNLHLKIYASMLAGRYAPAVETADELAANLPAELLRSSNMPLADTLEGFVPMRLHVMVRFGKWRELMEEPLPDDPELYCVTTALTHYARGVAHAAVGEVDEAAAEQRRFEDAASRVPETRMFFNIRYVDILAIARAMLAGEIAYRKQAFDVAFNSLRRAVELEDDLPYSEPWGWMQPVRHALGALLLEQGRVDEAAAVYRADLGLDESAPRVARHPGNVWALQGYVEWLDKLGHEEELARLRPKLDAARAGADVELSSSCFCRRQDSG
jgi:tetratricopeptide (TPR) repeat protein